MIRSKQSTIVEIDNDYEFCVIINKMSHIKYGRVIGLNKEAKTIKFQCLSYNKKNKKVLTDEIYDDVKAIRRIGFIDQNTWKDKTKTTYTITRYEIHKAYANATYEIEAESIEEAKNILKNNITEKIDIKSFLFDEFTDDDPSEIQDEEDWKIDEET